jgi:GDP-4-dehydro-6-deoxy-D-mannose reductase
MAKSILVAGINGFVGKHLAKELHSCGYEVFGTGMDENISPEITKEVKQYIKCDLTSPKDIEKLPLSDINAVINLAGLAQVGTSFGKEDLYNKINVEVHSLIIERIQQLNLNVRILVISTGAVYDNNQEMPLTESSPFINGGSPYAASKVLLEKTLEKYIEDGMDIIIARPFNHTGPGQLDGFIVPDLTSKILIQDEITVGPLNTSRDYTDVRDVVRAYRMIIEKPERSSHRVYNVCSGVPTSRDQIIEKIKAATGKETLEVKVDEALVRPNDALLIYGSNNRIGKDFGWQPSISIDKTIKDFVDWKKNLSIS